MASPPTAKGTVRQSARPCAGVAPRAMFEFFRRQPGPCGRARVRSEDRAHAWFALRERPEWRARCDEGVLGCPSDTLQAQDRLSCARADRMFPRASATWWLVRPSRGAWRFAQWRRPLVATAKVSAI